MSKRASEEIAEAMREVQSGEVRLSNGDTVKYLRQHRGWAVYRECVELETAVWLAAAVATRERNAPPIGVHGTFTAAVLRSLTTPTPEAQR